MPQRQPTPIFVPFFDTQDMRTTNVSDLDQLIVTATNPDGAFPTDPGIPQIISNLNSMAYWPGVDITNADVTCQWTPMSSGHVVKMFVNIAWIGDMTAHTDDDAILNNIRVTITEASTGNILWDRTYNPGIDTFNAANETRMFIIKQPVDNQALEIRQGHAVNIRLRSDLTFETPGTDPVFFNGVVPFFPTNIGAESKFFSQSGVVFYMDRDR